MFIHCSGVTLLLYRAVESRDKLQDVFADAGSPTFPREGTEQIGGSGFLPARGEGSTAVCQAGAAVAGKLGAVQGPIEILKVLHVVGEETAVVWGASCTTEAGGTLVPKNTGHVTLISHQASAAAVTGEAPASAVAHGRQRGHQGVR